MEQDREKAVTTSLGPVRILQISYRVVKWWALSVFNVFSPVDSGGVVSSKIDITVTTTPVATASGATASGATASDTPCPSSSSNQKGISVIIIFDENL